MLWRQVRSSYTQNDSDQRDWQDNNDTLYAQQQNGTCGDHTVDSAVQLVGPDLVSSSAGDRVQVIRPAWPCDHQCKLNAMIYVS